MKNPFRYGMRVGGCEFFDRTKIMRDIRNTLDGGNNVLLYGPQRYGKSSLLGEILAAVRKSGDVCVELNMMDIASLDDFIARYASAIYRELAPATGALKHVASPKAGLDALRDALELPERLCPDNRHVVIALDEFQEVTGLGLGVQFERTMRSIVEKQRHVSYIYLGSKTHLLERMFAAKSRPFYNSAQKFLLLRPPANESAAFLTARFASVGLKLSSSLADYMVAKVDNVPYYLQALGSWTFNATSGRGSRTVTQADVDEGFDSLYNAERILLENTFISHPQSQRLLMRALATEPTTSFPEAYRLRHGLASTSTVNTALRRLIAESTVDHYEDGYHLADPILAYHLSEHRMS